MINKYVKVGDRIEITDKSIDGRVMFSQVESILEPNELLIRAPVINGRLTAMSAGCELSVVIFTEKSIYKHVAHVTENVKQDGFNMLHIKLSGDGERVQRRDFFRISCEAPFYFKQVSDENAPFSGDDAAYGIVLDISGGGVRFISNHLLTEESLVKGYIVMEDQRAQILGKVLNAHNVPNALSEYKIQYRVRFMNLSDEVSETIIQYILKLQRIKLLNR